MRSNENPKVSICIPAFNGEAFIGPAIESVLSQTFEEFELIIIDDGSTDLTRSIISSYNDPRIRTVIHAGNEGAEKTWNQCLSEAAGQYVKILCHDDVLYPDCLQRQLEQFEIPGHSRAVLVCCARHIIDGRGKVIMTRRFSSSLKRLNGTAAIRRTIRAGTNLIGEPSAVLFRAPGESVGLQFDGSLPYVIDLDFWCKLLNDGDLVTLPEALCCFRVSPVSWSVRLSTFQARQFTAFCDKLHRQRRPCLSLVDRTSAALRAWVNTALRRILYSVLLSRSRK